MEADIEKLKNIARQIRIDILTMLVESNSGHTGGSLSATDILTVLYFYKMRYDPKNPKWEDRDKFVLSKGHGAPALYAVLGRAGYFGLEHFHTLRKLGSILRGHPNSAVTPGVEVCTGSLGQGLSQANGLALSARLDNKPARVYVVLGDGETDEGQVWEAAMTSANYKIDNLCAILDNNGLQIDGTNKEVMNIEPVVEKWKSFGWHVIEINGHDIKAIVDALNEAEKIKGKPTMIIAHTIKGKGVSFMENKVEYHGVAPTRDEYERAMKELGVS